MADNAPCATSAEPPLPTLRLERSFFARCPDAVAVALLGCALISVRQGRVSGGRIVETEAYFGADDPASHAARLRTGRVASMSGHVGIAYVYRSYGIHVMLNVVAHEPGETGAVLIRAVEPVWGVDAMRARRAVAGPLLLCSGPGRLCQALAIGLEDHGLDLTEGREIHLFAGASPAAILRGGRIGVSRGSEAMLRYFAAGTPFVSAHRRGAPFRPAPTRR